MDKETCSVILKRTNFIKKVKKIYILMLVYLVISLNHRQNTVEFKALLKFSIQDTMTKQIILSIHQRIFCESYNTQI